MALTLDQLTAARDALWQARADGVLAVQDQNGERVEYKSDAQMAAALAALNAEIRRASGTATPGTITFITSKGL